MQETRPFEGSAADEYHYSPRSGHPSLPFNEDSIYVKNSTLPTYNIMIGDPRYRYNKEAKEKFFKNPYLSFMFLYFAACYAKRFIDKKSSSVPRTFNGA